MDKKRLMINVIVSVLTKLILIILSIVARKAVLVNLGVDATGVTSLFASIVGFLAIAELGIGVSITYCMYDPIVKGDTKKVAALYRLFKKLYTYIFLVVLVVGVALTPLIPILSKGYTMDANIYILYLLTLAATLLSYSYASGQSLINAHKDNYITILIDSVLTILLYSVQILVLYLTKSFYLYLIINIFKNAIEFLVTHFYVSKKYSNIIHSLDDVDTETKKKISKNVRALFLHKIGGLLSNTLDSMIISTFLSVTILGFYSNYTSIVIALSTLVNMIFSSLISVVGHSLVQNDKEASERNFLFFHTANFMIGIIVYMGYYAVVDNFIEIVYGSNYIMEKSVIIVTTLNYFIQFMRQSIGLYKDASGCFSPDRYKPLIEGVINFCLSLALVFSLGVIGVVISTIITTLFICHTVEPYVLYKYAFDKKVNKFLLKHFILMGIFGLALLGFYFIPLPKFDNKFIEFLCNGFISVGYSLVFCLIIYIVDLNFREKLNLLLKKVVKRK